MAMRRSLQAGLLAIPLAVLVAGCTPPQSSAPSVAQVPMQEDPFAAKLRGMFGSIEKPYRPDVRWWLAEGLHTDDTLRKNVQAISDAGFGAAEFLAMPEPGADDKRYGWGSQEWTADSHLVIEEASRHGLGFSITSGTHWAHANLPDTYQWDGKPFTPDNRAASKELDYVTVPLKPGQAFAAALPRPPAVEDVHDQVFQGVVAVRVIAPRNKAGQGKDGGAGTLDFGSAIDLSAEVAQDAGGPALRWTAPDDGDYALFVYWMRGSAQTGEPSVSTNYTINYVDRYGTEALIDYWNAHILTPEVEAMVRENGRGELYMDSLELIAEGGFGSLWGYDFKREFRQRAGYDITRYLPFLAIDYGNGWGPKPRHYLAAGADQAQVEKIRNDFYKVLSDLYQENVLRPLQAWLHTKGMTLRAEPAYCYTYEISTPARYVDHVETETIEFSGEFDLLRGMLGGANMYGRPFSSETGATFGRNYWYDTDYFTQLSYLYFANGVSRIVFHGYSAIEGSEADTRWPGHEGMYPVFSERFSTRQPAWAQYPAWTEMLGRNQKVLRQGQPQRDVAILRTDFNYRAFSQPGSVMPETSWAMHDQAYYWKDLSLQHAGYTYDFFSPQLLEDAGNARWSGGLLQPDGPAYQAVIVYQGSLELTSARKLLEVARSGVPVVFVNNVTETLSHGAGAPLFDVTYPEAAATSKFRGDADADLRAVVAQIKALPGVREIDDQGQTLRTLQELGVKPRVAYAQPNNSLLTYSRLDKANGILYTFAYAFKFEVDKDAPAQTYTLSLAGAGAPYRINDWTGEVSRLGSYRVADGRTQVAVTLKPGQAQIIAVNLNDPGDALHALSTSADEIQAGNGALALKASASGRYTTALSDGRTLTTEVQVPAAIALPSWDIVIEDWNAGDKVTLTESKFGHTTTEVYFKTDKTRLDFPGSALLPWKDLPATAQQLAQLKDTTSMAQVSGIGTYSTRFDLPEGWGAANGAVLELGPTGGALTTVNVNGQAAPGVDPRSGTVDISRLLTPGSNRIEVVLSSSLTNRMLQRGYPQGWNGNDGDKPEPPSVRAYGLRSQAAIRPYTLAPLTE